MRILNLAFSFWLAVTGLWPSFLAPAVALDCSTPLQTLINTNTTGTLFLPACTYTENVTISKDLAIIGATSSGETILQAPANQRIITLAGDHTLNLQYLTLTGGSPVVGNAGGAILADGGSLQISHSHFYNNSASDGGAIYQGKADGVVRLTNDLFENNHSTNGQGGAIFANGTIISTDSIFNSNTANSHGGAMTVWTGDTTITGGSFTSNTAGGNGGAVNVNNGLSVSGVTFTSNTSGDSGGAITQWNASFTISIVSSNFHGNKATNKGGGVYVNSVVILNQDWFDANSVDSGTINTVNTYGGGVFAGNTGKVFAVPAVTVQNSKFTGNATHCKLGCYSKGGGIYIENIQEIATPTLAVLSNVIFDANSSWDGGGLYANYSQVNADHLTFTNNIAGYGAGMAPYILDGEALFFKGNQAEDQGGGVRGFQLSIRQSTFLDNTAKYAGGSALYVGSTLSLTNVLIAHNTEFSTGYGTVSLGANSSGVFNNVTFAQPILGTGTAVYLGTGANYHIFNTIIANYNYCYDVYGALYEDHILYSTDTHEEKVETGGHFYNNGYNLAFDALFVEPATGDYHLKSTSPAIAGGLYMAGVDVDLDYRPRRTGHSAMGAYNFWWLELLPLVNK